MILIKTQIWGLTDNSNCRCTDALVNYMIPTYVTTPFNSRNVLRSLNHHQCLCSSVMISIQVTQKIYIGSSRMLPAIELIVGRPWRKTSQLNPWGHFIYKGDISQATKLNLSVPCRCWASCFSMLFENTCPELGHHLVFAGHCLHRQSTIRTSSVFAYPRVPFTVRDQRRDWLYWQIYDDVCRRDGVFMSRHDAE